MRLLHPLAAGVLAAACAAAQAGLVDHDESTDGDLAGADPLPTFVLDSAGLNTIAGTIGQAGTCDGIGPGAPFDCDSFALVVAEGLRIVSFTVTASDPRLQWRIGTGTLDAAGAEIARLVGSAGLGTGPLLADEMNVSWISFPTDTGGIDYRFSIQTQPVPEPAAWALFGLGGLALALRARWLSARRPLPAA